MAHIVVAGISSCPRYAQAEFIAGILSSKLPHFKVRRLVIKVSDWERWLLDLCQKNKWMHTMCPIVWRELAMPGGKPVLIGGLSEFLEFCHEYYGLTTLLSAEQKQTLVEDNIQIDKKNKEHREERDYKVRKILISGVSPHVLPILISELLNLKCMARNDGTVIYIYDKSKKRYILNHIQKDSILLGADAGLKASKVTDNFQEGLENCHVFIIFIEFRREYATDFKRIFKENYTAMKKYAKIIDEHAPPNCRVIITGPADAPLCFNATILLNASTSLAPNNLVVVTAHIGAESMPVITKLTQTQASDFGAPAVWGFIGLNQYIDFDNMIYKATYFVPNKRALRRIPNSTLPQGKVITELRRFSYMMENIKNIGAYLQQLKTATKETASELPELPQVKAIVTLLELWYTKEYDGELISLGIASNGSFGIPPGIVFSQPVILQNHFWSPYTDYPKPDKSKCDIDNFINAAILVMMENANDVVYKYAPIWKNVNTEKLEIEEKKKKESKYKYPEFPNPLQKVKECRKLNEIGVERAISKIELRWEIDRENNISPQMCTMQKFKNLYESSTTCTRISSDSMESLMEQKLEIQESITEKNVRETLDEIIRKLGNAEDRKIKHIEKLIEKRNKTDEDDNKNTMNEIMTFEDRDYTVGDLKQKANLG